MGHELQHGFNHHAKLKATRTFLDDIRKQAGAKGPVHDYTDELRAYIQAGREDEAKAEIAGWNALLSLEKQHNPRAGLVQMHRTQNDRVLAFIEQDQITQLIHPKPGLPFTPEGSLSHTPAHTPAMCRRSFARPPPT